MTVFASGWNWRGAGLEVGPGVEEVVGAGGGEADGGGGVVFGEPELEFGANLGLEVGGGGRKRRGRRRRRRRGKSGGGFGWEGSARGFALGWPARSRRYHGWDVDFGWGVCGVGGEVGDGGDGAGGVQVPFGEEAVGGKIAMERAGGDSVEIGDVGARDCAEAIEIEMRVAGFERVEGPFDQADIAREGFFALEEFQGAANFAITIFGEDAGHVGVEVGEFIADANDGHGEADHDVAIEGAEDLAASLIGDDEGDVGFGFEVGLAPDGALEFDAAVEVWERGAFADLDLGSHEGR
jgi:hypothetical protein